MLVKAILTGGVLSALAGSIVYFGTEGADALESNERVSLRVEDTDLAGAPDEAVGDLSGETSSEETAKKKTKLFGQYLKRSKSEDASDSSREAKDEVVEPELKGRASEDKKETRSKRRAEKKSKRDGAHDEAKGSYIVSKDVRVETLDLDSLDLDALDLDGDIDVQALKDQLGLDPEKDVKVRVIKKVENVRTEAKPKTKKRKIVDYDTVLVEAKKLLVTDMRNQAVLEIIDYAVDNGDMGQAADIVEELSTPELRDTARARIGTGLARRGKADAAFAVVEALEIDELAAPIRLEIITALVATKQERKAQRSSN